MHNRVSKTAAEEDQKDCMDIENLITREQINSTLYLKGKPPGTTWTFGQGIRTAGRKAGGTAV